MTEYYSKGRLINGERNTFSKILVFVIFVIITLVLVRSTRFYEKELNFEERKTYQLEVMNLKLKSKINELKEKLKTAANLQKEYGDE